MKIKRCPNCNRDQAKMEYPLTRLGLTTVWCRYCKYYSLLKPNSKNTWYCSQSMDIIEKMLREDQLAK